MSIQEHVGIRTLDTPHDLDEARVEAIGYVFHGTLPPAEGKRPAVKAGSNLLHFARCAKLDKVPGAEVKLWFRTIGLANTHLDEAVGASRWKWCKICEREITQKILNER